MDSTSPNRPAAAGQCSRVLGLTLITGIQLPCQDLAIEPKEQRYDRERHEVAEFYKPRLGEMTVLDERRRDDDTNRGRDVRTVAVTRKPKGNGEADDRVRDPENRTSHVPTSAGLATPYAVSR